MYILHYNLQHGDNRNAPLPFSYYNFLHVEQKIPLKPNAYTLYKITSEYNLKELREIYSNLVILFL